ncbi:PAS domain S-box protein [Leptospira sp. 201903070]|uniref:histidine kinase n=1 Tax=Leptospira ainlahdjerensis TaxID=2810033 RepID=A0ABS2UDI6_9LEPT|nr:PAS domain S-box protein [Leptospira ainlahdjerensis]MBM9578418.1 PAS domain S-box protein [Leptospira ainlahdjerensis]
MSPNQQTNATDGMLNPREGVSIQWNLLLRKNGEILSADSNLLENLGYSNLQTLTAPKLIRDWNSIRSQDFLWKGSLILLDSQDQEVRLEGFVELLSEDVFLFRLFRFQIEKRMEDLFFQIFHKNLAIKLIIEVETGKIVNVSESALEFYGYSRDEFLKLRISDINLLNPEQIKTEMLLASSENRLHFNFIHRLKSGIHRDVEVFSGPISLNNKTYLYSIIHDVTERNRALEARAISEKKYRNLIELAADGIVLIGPDGSIEEANPMSSELTGYPKESMLGMTAFDMIDSDNLSESPLRLEEGSTLIRERVIRRADGSLIPVEINAVSLEHGRLLAVVRDIRERKLIQKKMENSLKEKELMLQEIHHRVKNNLQIVSSLLSLHSEFNENPYLQKVLRECELRVKSMALVHEELYRSDDLAKVDLKSYYFSLSSNLLSIYGRSEKVQIHDLQDSFFMSIDRAIPIGLILNELLTNSLKYAFEDDQNGEIFLLLKKRNEQVELEYRDTGVGFDLDQAQELQNGLGLKLIDMLSQQLHAKLSLKTEKGFFLRMLFDGWKE